MNKRTPSSISRKPFMLSVLLRSEADGNRGACPQDLRFRIESTRRVKPKLRFQASVIDSIQMRTANLRRRGQC